MDDYYRIVTYFSKILYMLETIAYLVSEQIVFTS